MKIPGWLGPLVGPAVGAVCYVWAVRRSGTEVNVTVLLGMIAAGFAAGCLLWAGDWWNGRRDRKRRRLQEGQATHDPDSP